MGNQEICHPKSIPSDRFSYNIWSSVITAESPHKNQRTPGVLPDTPGSCKAFSGRSTAKTGAGSSARDSVLLHLPWCAQLLENEVSPPSGSFPALLGHWSAVVCCLGSLGSRGLAGTERTKGFVGNNTYHRTREAVDQGRGKTASISL